MYICVVCGHRGVSKLHYWTYLVPTFLYFMSCLCALLCYLAFTFIIFWITLFCPSFVNQSSWLVALLCASACFFRFSDSITSLNLEVGKCGRGKIKFSTSKYLSSFHFKRFKSQFWSARRGMCPEIIIITKVNSGSRYVLLLLFVCIIGLKSIFEVDSNF